MNKKFSLMLVLLMSILIISSCSNNESSSIKDNNSVSSDEKIEDIGYMAKLAYDPSDIKSLFDITSEIILVKGLDYEKTIMKKDDFIPETVYTAKYIQRLDRGYDLSKELDAQLTTYNNDSIKVIINGGIVTKGQVYDVLNEEQINQLAWNKQLSKASIDTKFRVYMNNYLEFNNTNTYLIFANHGGIDNNFYCIGYTVFEYDQDSGKFSNKFSKLEFKIEDLIRYLR